MFESSSYSDAMVLAKAAKILRKHMVDHKFKFQSNIYENSVCDSLPSALLQFVCMIEHGADIELQLRFGQLQLIWQWLNFLRDSYNKTELFEYLADKIIEICPKISL